jgi:L-aminopeptidase/D-esterase-like protein
MPWIGRAALVAIAFPSVALAQAPAKGLTAVAGLKVGHHTLAERPTGCTVVLAGAGAVAGVDVRGGAPGTRETDLLDPVNTVEKAHAIVLSGGSAFGLDAASGTMRWLEEKGIGFDTGVAKVPIVPAAILFDLGVGDAKVRPTADCGYKAAAAATDGPVAEGNVGAGAGATIGKLGGPGRAMKGGLGSAAITLPGVRTPDGSALADARTLVRAGSFGRPPRPAENTTIGIVATNARLTKAQATKMAQMAQDGFARAISPAHTPADGDTIFALATGTLAGEGDVMLLGTLAAEVMADAILHAARAATGIPGYPAARDRAAAAPKR